MMTSQALSQRVQGKRLLALLLVLLLLSPGVALPGMATCASDCAMQQVDAGDAGESQCVACSPVPSLPVLSNWQAEPLASGAEPAMLDHIPRPPRRPPRV